MIVSKNDSQADHYKYAEGERVTFTITVNNTELEGYAFDGRIKIIALIFAYDDDDNDKISY